MLKQLSTNQNLNTWVIQQFNQSDSPLSEFLELFTVEFILDNLDKKNQRLFLDKIANHEEDAIDFGCRLIANFDERFSFSFQEKLLDVLMEEKEDD